MEKIFKAVFIQPRTTLSLEELNGFFNDGWMIHSMEAQNLTHGFSNGPNKDDARYGGFLVILQKEEVKKNDITTRLKMFWFARWLAMNYGSDVLNNEKGEWYAVQLKHFEEVVYPNFLKESKEKGDYNETLNLLSKTK